MQGELIGASGITPGTEAWMIVNNGTIESTGSGIPSSFSELVKRLDVAAQLHKYSMELGKHQKELARIRQLQRECEEKETTLLQSIAKARSVLRVGRSGQLPVTQMEIARSAWMAARKVAQACLASENGYSQWMDQLPKMQ